MAGARSLPVVARLLLLCLASVAGLLALKGGRAGPAVIGSAAAGYACPMHRQVISATPGTCSFCGMELVRQAGGSGGSSPPSTEPVRRRILQHEPRIPAWVESDGRIVGLLYGDDLALFTDGDPGLFHPAASPAASTAVQLTGRSAPSHDPSTWRVAFRSEARAGGPRPGVVGWIDLPARSGASLLVPASAVLTSPEGPYVLALDPDGSTLTRRPVTLGRTRSGLSVILAGVSENERVAARGAFFLDAERKLAASEGR